MKRLYPVYLDLRWLDIAFDILYFGDTSVIHQTLKERHEILRKVVRPVKGRLEILVPNGGINRHRSSSKIFLEALSFQVKLVICNKLNAYDIYASF